jgi:hypothetical protein
MASFLMSDIVRREFAEMPSAGADVGRDLARKK